MTNFARYKRRNRIVAIITLIYLLVFWGCTVKFVSDYDPTFDKGITELNQKVDKFIVELEKNYVKMKAAKNDAQRQELQNKISYAQNETFYTDTRVDLQVLTTRAEVTPKNQLTVQQLNSLSKLLDEMEKQHKEGFQNVGELELDRQAFNRSFRAILKFEIAKKRGQKS